MLASLERCLLDRSLGWSLQCDSDNGCVGNVVVLEQDGLQLGGGDLEGVDLDDLLEDEKGGVNLRDPRLQGK